MITSRRVIGIDVGGEKKGFHAIALCDGKFLGKIADFHSNVIAKWCLDHRAEVVGVDAPCRWSQSGSSRLAERKLEIAGEKVHCFATPTRERALHRKFYQWVFNGEKLYKCLEAQYPLFDGQRKSGRVCFETFPHAIVCAMAGRVISAKSKGTVRRNVLQRRGYDVRDLHNIDFVDAALCAVTADAFSKGDYQLYGDAAEGIIVVPRLEFWGYATQ